MSSLQLQYMHIKYDHTALLLLCYLLPSIVDDKEVDDKWMEVRYKSFINAYNTSITLATIHSFIQSIDLFIYTSNTYAASECESYSADHRRLVVSHVFAVRPLLHQSQLVGIPVGRAGAVVVSTVGEGRG